MLKTMLGISLAMALGLSGPAKAALLLGKTVQLSYELPAMGVAFDGPFDNIVGTTGDTAFVSGYVMIGDMLVPNGQIIATPSDGQLRIHVDPCVVRPGCLFAPFPFNGIHLRDALGEISAFASVTINPLTDLPGFDISRISFDDDNIYLNFASLTGGAHDVVIDIRAAGGVPEPGTWALMIVGFGLAARALRRAGKGQLQVVGISA